jgi:class 3 adenylate cyclase
MITRRAIRSPTGTVTFLFTDVEGSTSLLRELGAEEYADALAEHRRVVREACAAEGGVEVDTQGTPSSLRSHPLREPRVPPWRQGRSRTGADQRSPGRRVMRAGRGGCAVARV